MAFCVYESFNSVNNVLPRTSIHTLHSIFNHNAFPIEVKSASIINYQVVNTRTMLGQVNSITLLPNSGHLQYFLAICTFYPPHWSLHCFYGLSLYNPM